MIRINQIKLAPDHSEKELTDAIKKKLGHPKKEFTYEIARQSVDGRNKPFVKYIYSVNVFFKDMDYVSEINFVKKVNNKDIMFTTENKYTFSPNNDTFKSRKIVIAGSGPAGLFCGLMLARAGARPVIIERGLSVMDRCRKVDEFFENGKLDTECNVQFGEGGAGTFSDGKLNTQIKDSTGRIRKVLETFVEFGADKEILYSSKPHIGTDVLVDVVKNMRNEIIRLGGEVRFNCKMTDIVCENNRVTGIIVNDTDKIACDVLVLALGHSARDTFYMLNRNGIDMRAKAFAVGVRIEHPQKMIDEYAYGENIYELPAASYKVTHKAELGRGVYSFCMCPGGYVVNASSENERLCINGMSYSKRDSENANSAIVVTVTPDDYGDTSPLSGIEFQRKLEEAAYTEGNGNIPCQTYKSFKEGTVCTGFANVVPVTKGGISIANLRNILPDYICRSIVEGIEGFSRQIPGFNMEDAILFAVESRTSSPVRIVRDDKSFMCNIEGIYPCGEGAGYAGGITSAAIDGIKIAEAIAGI